MKINYVSYNAHPQEHLPLKMSFRLSMDVVKIVEHLRREASSQGIDLPQVEIRVPDEWAFLDTVTRSPRTFGFAPDGKTVVSASGINQDIRTHRSLPTDLEGRLPAKIGTLDYKEFEDYQIRVIQGLLQPQLYQ